MLMKHERCSLLGWVDVDEMAGKDIEFDNERYHNWCCGLKHQLLKKGAKRNCKLKLLPAPRWPFKTTLSRVFVVALITRQMSS
jgi:hypothetical protein